MKKVLIKFITFLLFAVTLISSFALPTALAVELDDLPAACVIYDGTNYYMMDFDELFDSYLEYSDDPDSDGAKLAKFYFDVLSVDPMRLTAYVSPHTEKFVSFYEMLLKYIDTDLETTYEWFNSTAATSAFLSTVEVKVLGPDGSITGSLFVGYDGYEVINPIENPSVEIADPNDPAIPESWANNSWGDNTATFTYLDDGHASSHSVKVEVSGYVDGDAKWFFNPIQLEPGDYVFNDYYKSDVDSRLVLAVTTGTGDTKYLDMPSAPASEDWTKYESSFTMPEDGETITVYHLLSRDGYLITDDYYIGPYNYEGFDRGLVTITFDDGWEENTVTALPVMQTYGFKSNQFYATTYIENDPTADPNLIDLFINDGHEIGSHSITHPDLTTLTAEEVMLELEGSKQFLENRFGISVTHFATPYGAYNTLVKNKIMEVYDTHRTVDSGFNSKDNLDVTRLKSMSILSTTTASEVEKWVKKAKEEKLWLILLYHRIGDNPGDYDTTPAMFAQQIQVINDNDIPVVTISQALAEIQNQ